MKSLIQSSRNRYGFTIIELLVVIVVIGILAALIVVSYIGINQKAIAASLESDLVGASRQLELYKVDYGTYPSSLSEPSPGTYCPVPQDDRYCFKLSSDNRLPAPLSDSYKPAGNNSTYTLIAKNGDVAYQSTNTSSPVSISLTLSAIAAISGTTTQGQTLTAGARTPANATVDYQWSSSATVGGTYTNISPNGTYETYTITPNEVGKYIKVTATATGIYTGTITSTATTIVIALPPTNGTIQPATLDTYISAQQPNTNNSTLEAIHIGGDASGYDIRGLITFDFSSIVPTGATITAANLGLYIYQHGAAGESKTYQTAHLLRYDYEDAQATWTIFKTSNNWSTAGCSNTTLDCTYDYSASIVAPNPIVDNVWWTWNVLSEVNHCKTNHNSVMKSRISGNTSASAWVSFRSSNYISDTSLRPKLYIEWTGP